MSYPWYERVPGDSPLDQGDLILDCPVAGWREGPLNLSTANEPEQMLHSAVQYEKLDVVVMSQTCDLRQNKVRYVVLCAHYPIEEYRRMFTDGQGSQGQRVTEKSWVKYLESIAAGRRWNLSILNREDGDGYRAELRVVDFHEVFNLPRDFLESWLRKEGKQRLRLRPPYREHLSQAFARFFMRVGLPTEVNIP